MPDRNRGGGEIPESESGLSVLDFFSTVDDVLEDRIIPVIEDIRDGVNDIELEADIEDLTVEQRDYVWEAPVLSAKVEPRGDDENYSETEVIYEAPFDGEIREVMVGFPDGSDEWVGVQVSHYSSGDRIFPPNKQQDQMSGNDFYKSFKQTYQVEKGDKIVVRYRNYDSSERRIVNTTLQIRGEK